MTTFCMSHYKRSIACIYITTGSSIGQIEREEEDFMSVHAVQMGP